MQRQLSMNASIYRSEMVQSRVKCLSLMNADSPCQLRSPCYHQIMCNIILHI